PPPPGVSEVKKEGQPTPQPNYASYENITIYTSSHLQAIHKKAREERRKLLTPSHKYIFDILADRLSLTPSAVEEFILDSPSLAAFDHFFAAGGHKRISFVYQESEEICFSMIDATDGLLKGIRNAYAFLLPILEGQESWGALDQSRHGEKLKKNFMDNYKHFLSELDGRTFYFSQNNAVVRLSPATNIDLSKLTCLDEMKAAAANFEMVQELEDLLSRWCKEIEQVLTEDDQLRKIDHEGPLSELEHWKKKHLQFNSIVNHTKSEECKAVVMVLYIRRSKMIKVWRDLDNRITDRLNEAKDYLKFLSTLEKVLQSLYNNDPDSLIKSVHSLIRAIEIIQEVPLFRNTNEKIPTLLLKVTNQLVTACRAHITDHGKSFVWDQDDFRFLKFAVNVDHSFTFLIKSDFIEASNSFCTFMQT
uniref:Dynein heavy chain tail domain-containing protein n=1 Tax=Fundulus heteroclitus TaxID=8078 RepID=A0A3Q2QWB4_FUNHE